MIVPRGGVRSSDYIDCLLNLALLGLSIRDFIFGCRSPLHNMEQHNPPDFVGVAVHEAVVRIECEHGFLLRLDSTYRRRITGAAEGKSRLDFLPPELCHRSAGLS